MPEPEKLLPVTPQMESTAREQRIDAVIHSAQMMTGAGNVLSVVALAAPKTARILGHNLLSFEIAPLRPGRAPIKPGPLFEWYVLPPPLGIVPPEYYGASPTYLGDQFPGLPKSAMLGTSTTPERAAVYAAKKQRERAENEILAVISHAGTGRAKQIHADVAALRPVQRQQGTVLEFQTQILERELTFHKIPFTPIPFITPAEAARIPPEPFGVVLDEFPKIGAPVQPVGQQPIDVAALAPVTTTFSALVAQGVSLLALASGAAAEGIRKELIHERADP